MSSEALKERLLRTLDVESMGDHRIYNWCMDHLKSHEEVKQFMVSELGYATWEVNKIRARKRYRHAKWLLLKETQFNSANKI